MKILNSIKGDKFSDNVKNIILLIIFIGMVAFHMWAASFGVYPSYQLSSVHWALVGTYILIIKPLKFKGGPVIDAFLCGLNLFVCIYQIILQESFVQNAGIYSQTDIYVSIIAIVLALVIAGRIVGVILPIICMLFIAYAYWGKYVPGMFQTIKFSFSRIAPYLYTAYDGIFGQTLTVSAQFIYLFVLFGSLLELTGAGEFFVDLSFALTKKLKGDPAQAAVYSSMLLGTINGSGAANVVTTGTFTIPLMKKVGFKSSFAGAVEAVASSGGQIMLPVMGAVAFLMSELTGIPYGKIALAAIIPAVLYYITLSISVYFIATKSGISQPESEEQKSTWAILKKGYLYLLPIILLIVMLVMGYSTQKSAFFAILSTIIIGFIMNKRNMTFSNVLNALANSLKGIAPIAAACFLAGIIMGIINLTGLGLKISGMIEIAARGNLIIALILSMFTSLLLGMGLPTSAAYMILAVLVAPALINMGASQIAAHLFILYFGALSTITPPVALSTFAAAGIAKAKVWETGKDAIKLACTGFIIPFIFVYNQEILWSGTFIGVIIAFITAVIGCTIISASLTGWLMIKLSVISRIILFPAGIMLFIANPFYWNFIGLFIALVVTVGETINRKRN